MEACNLNLKKHSRSMLAYLNVSKTYLEVRNNNPIFDEELSELGVTVNEIIINVGRIAVSLVLTAFPNDKVSQNLLKTLSAFLNHEAQIETLKKFRGLTIYPRRCYYEAAMYAVTHTTTGKNELMGAYIGISAIQSLADTAAKERGFHICSALSTPGSYTLTITNLIEALEYSKS